MSVHLEERLRGAAALGDLEGVQALLQKGVDVNARDESDGWTCLHWACKRNHVQVVIYLLACGADKEIVTNEGDQAAWLTSKAEIKRMFGVEEDNQESDLSLPVVANSLTNPLSPCQETEKVPNISAPQDSSIVISEGDSSRCLSATQEEKDCESSSLHNETELAEQGHSEGVCGFPTGVGPSECTKHSVHNCPVYTSSVLHNGALFTSARSTQHKLQRANSSCMDTALPWQPLLLTGTFPCNTQELVLKVRVQNSEEDDFIEIELNRQELTYPDLLRVSSSELGVNPEQVEKIRKLPNTLVRKDKDVARLQDFQELELVLGETIHSTFTKVAAPLIERPCYNIKAAKLTY